MECVKCGGEMQKGKEIAIGTVSTGNLWLEEGSIVKFGKPEIISYSCIQCGYIESYTKR